MNHQPSSSYFGRSSVGEDTSLQFSIFQRWWTDQRGRFRLGFRPFIVVRFPPGMFPKTRLREQKQRTTSEIGIADDRRGRREAGVQRYFTSLKMFSRHEDIDDFPTDISTVCPKREGNKTIRSIPMRNGVDERFDRQRLLILIHRPRVEHSLGSISTDAWHYSWFQTIGRSLVRETQRRRSFLFSVDRSKKRCCLHWQLFGTVYLCNK